MVTFKEALKIVENKLPQGQTVSPSYGEIQDKYVFRGQFSDGCIPPGGCQWTVHKETGECKFEHLEHEGNKMWAPIKGYKKIDPNQIN